MSVRPAQAASSHLDEPFGPCPARTPADHDDAGAPSRLRGRQRALLAVGLTLTETRDWDALTIADLAAASEMSVGSFYNRFADKQTYLMALVGTVARQTRRQIDAHARRAARAGRPLRDLVEDFVDQSIGTHARLRGVLRAAVLSQRIDARRAASRDRRAPQATVASPREAIGAIRAVRAHARQRFVEVLAPHLSMPADEANRRLGFAHQLLTSTLLNAVLTDPGPLSFDDPAFRREMVQSLCAYLGVEGRH